MDSNSQRIRFDRNEFSGAFGDIGTDFPLLVGMILAADLDITSVLAVYGAMQIFTGLTYGMPMPVQPLKAMAVIVITQNISGSVLAGGGLAIGLVMLLLSITGLIDWLARAVPKSVVRGIQLGLGLQLASLALKDYVPAAGRYGYVLAACAFVVTLALLGNRREPPAPFVIVLGILYAFAFQWKGADVTGAFGFHLPQMHAPSWSDVVTGFFLLSLPQIPLSLGNSILATKQVVADLFPQKQVTTRKISLTYSLMNLVSPWLGGVPVCHGSGGIAGHYAFGGRTGGSVVIYGLFYLTLGLFLSGGFHFVVDFFPKPVLGVILLFEALALVRLTRDMAVNAADFSVVLLVGLIAFALPYGYVVGLVIGWIVAVLAQRKKLSLNH